jgi:septum site-determining protein MinC
MSAAITVKGLRDGVLIILNRGELAALLTELAELIDSRKTFFQGGQVAVQVGERRLERDALVGLCRVFSQRGVGLSALLADDPSTRSAAQDLGLRTRLASDVIGPAPFDTLAQPSKDSLEERQGVLVERTLRSGQSIYCPGHVVILGDVNPGAQVVAGGDVIVWGRLRGSVHAGASGDPERCVCALELSPIQLRIGSHIARPRKKKKRKRKEPRPQRAYVSDDQIIAERWR